MCSEEWATALCMLQHADGRPTEAERTGIRRPSVLFSCQGDARRCGARFDQGANHSPPGRSLTGLTMVPERQFDQARGLLADRDISMVRDFAEQSGGTATIESGLGTGTSITRYIYPRRAPETGRRNRSDALNQELRAAGSPRFGDLGSVFSAPANSSLEVITACTLGSTHAAHLGVWRQIKDQSISSPIPCGVVPEFRNVAGVYAGTTPWGHHAALDH